MTNYLDRAVTTLRTMGINLANRDPAPILPLLEKVQHYDGQKVMAIATTLQYSSTFNAALRDQISGMDVSARYANITDGFNSIHSDAVQMAQWMDDGRLDLGERIKLGWMNLRRGSIPDRFNGIRTEYLDVAKASNDQIGRENSILEAYRDFRMALKSAEVDAQDVLKVAAEAVDVRKAALVAAGTAVDGVVDGAERSRLELARDEALRAVQDEDKSYQIVKDIADDLKTSYNTAELIFARLSQTHSVKERLYQRAVTFFSTNEVVFSGLSAAFTASAGLAETTNTLNAMSEGVSKSLESMAMTGNAQLEAGMRAGYGSTVRASSVRSLADAIVEFQASSTKLIEELRAESTHAANEIEAATEQGKKRFIDLVNKGGANG